MTRIYKQPVYLMHGASCAGKTWVMDRLYNEFHTVPHDTCRLEFYGTAIEKASRRGLPVLAEAPFRGHELVKELHGYGLDVHEIYVLVKPVVLIERYTMRNGRPPHSIILVNNNNNWGRFGEGEFAGDSQQVFDYLKEVSNGQTVQ